MPLQLSGPNRVVFPDGNGQQTIGITASGNTGSVNYSVTGVPAQVISVRKTSGSAALAVGASLTAAEAAALVATRTASVGPGPTISRAAITGFRSRVFASGTAAPTFTVGSAADVSAINGGNFWIPNFPNSGTGTLTVELMFDTGTAITLANIAELFMQLDYTSTTTAAWTGVVAKAIVSTNGTAVTVLNTLSTTPDSTNPNSQQRTSGTVTGAPSARWFGVQFTFVPRRYPMIFGNVAVSSSVVGSYTNLPTPVFLSVQGTESGTGSTISRAAVTGFRSRVFASGTTAPAFAVGSAADVSAINGGNFWIPNFPNSGTGTLTVELLFDTGTAITLANIAELFMQLDYTSTTTAAWNGVVAKAIVSANGTAVTVLNTLSTAPETTNPNSQQRVSGPVTGAPAARWFGVQFTLVPRRYPMIFYNVSVSTAGASTASITIPIGDTTTNFGPPAALVSVTGSTITRLGATDLNKPLGLGITGGTPPYTIALNTQGVVAPVTLGKTATGTALSGSSVALTLVELQALVARRSTRTEYTPGTSIDYAQTISIRSERNGVTTLLDASLLSAFVNRNFFGIAGGASTTSSGFVAELPVAAQIGSVNNMPLRYGYGETVPVGTTIEFVTSTDGLAINVVATIALPAKDLDGNYTVSATSLNSPISKYWGLRFKFSAATNSGGIGFYNGVTPLLATPAIPYQAPNPISAPSTFIITVSDSAANSASGTFRVGAGDTVIVEAPSAAEPAFVELQELVGATWTSRGTLSLTGRIADIAPDSGMRFEGSTGAVWVQDPSLPLPAIGSFEAWGIRFACGAPAARKYSYCVGLKPLSSGWPTYPFGDVTLGRQTVPAQQHRWLVKSSSGSVVETLDWNGNPINSPGRSPKEFWPADAAGNLNVPFLRPYHVGQAVCGWSASPTVRTSAANIFPKVDAALEWTFRSPGLTNPQDYSMTLYQRDGLFNIYAMDAIGFATTQFAWTSEDPAMVTGGSRHISSAMYGYRYFPGQTSGRDVTTGPGGTRNVDRCVVGDPFAHVIQNPAAIRPHRNVAWREIALEIAKSYASENCFHITNPRLPKPVALTAPGAAPSYGRWYYGTGDIADPQTIDLNSGRADAINGENETPPRPGKYALSKTDPSGWLYWTGQIPDSEHNYPFAAIGALLFESPMHWWMSQFHFLQSSMVQNRTGYLTSGPGSWLLRSNAWPWASAAYLWAIQDSNHPMAVISRAKLEAHLLLELVRIADVEVPYLNSEPANLDSVDDYNRAMIKRFGGLGSSFVKSTGPTLLPIGYLCQGLELWKKFGLWDRMRGLDSRCGVALDYIISRIGKATVDLLIDAPYILALQADEYNFSAIQPQVWPLQEPPAGTPPSALLQSWAAWAAANPANGSTFWTNSTGQNVYGIGQYHVLHCVTALKRVFNASYPRLDAAETQARQLMAAKVASIRALPIAQRSSHFGTLMVYQNLIATTENGAVTTF